MESEPFDLRRGSFGSDYLSMRADYRTISRDYRICLAVMCLFISYMNALSKIARDDLGV